MMGRLLVALAILSVAATAQQDVLEPLSRAGRPSNGRRLLTQVRREVASRHGWCGR